MFQITQGSKSFEEQAGSFQQILAKSKEYSKEGVDVYDLPHFLRISGLMQG